MTRCDDCRAHRRKTGSDALCTDCRARRRAEWNALPKDHPSKVADRERHAWLRVVPDEIAIEQALNGYIDTDRLRRCERREIVLKFLREGRLSHLQIAERAGVSDRTVTRWSVELQRRGERLARGLGV